MDTKTTTKAADVSRSNDDIVRQYFSFKGVNGPQDMVIWLMRNEGCTLADGYGRRWKYENYTFSFGDLGGEMKEGVLSCVHLCGTVLHHA